MCVPRAAALIAVVCALAGCGSEPSSRVECPEATIDGAAGPNEFDANELVGLRMPAAEARARESRCVVRVVEEDGRRLEVFLNEQRFRVNVIVEHGVIVGVRDIG
jgi:hypothetical protein